MIAKNFKFLYQYYKDKQEVLAQMLHVPQSNISAYINGKKPIPTDVLHNIAIRYNVSADDLISKDLSLEFDSPQTLTVDDAAHFGENMLPILTSNTAKANDHFNTAYDILLQSLLLDRIDDFYGKIESLEHAIDLFQTAWDESNTYVALTNSLSAILLIYAFYNQKGVKIGQELLTNGTLNTLDIKSSLLQDPRKPVAENKYEKHRKLFFEKYDDLVYQNIKLLKGNAQFSELGDFYLAMCYFFGFAEDFIDYESCTQSAMLMLVQLCKLGNKYADSFLESLPAIS